MHEPMSGAAHGNSPEPPYFKCFCEYGYEGEICDQVIKVCESNPCRNGGACSDSFSGLDRVGDFECDCALGFEGVTCKKDVNECLSAPCADEFTVGCEDRVDEWVCLCEPTHTGTRCDIDIDECLNSNCMHGSTCDQQYPPDDEPWYTCFCLPGYTGIYRVVLLKCDIWVGNCRSFWCMVTSVIHGYFR